jgi:hypothetical protein
MFIGVVYMSNVMVFSSAAALFCGRSKNVAAVAAVLIITPASLES